MKSVLTLHATRKVSPNTYIYTRKAAHLWVVPCLFVHIYRCNLAILTSVKHVQNSILRQIYKINLNVKAFSAKSFSFSS